MAAQAGLEMNVGKDLTKVNDQEGDRGSQEEGQNYQAGEHDQDGGSGEPGGGFGS